VSWKFLEKVAVPLALINGLNAPPENNGHIVHIHFAAATIPNRSFLLMYLKVVQPSRVYTVVLITSGEGFIHTFIQQHQTHNHTLCQFNAVYLQLDAAALSE